MSDNKLWSKEITSASALIETFTVGRDKEFDVLLAEYDVLGSLAHTEMLASVGLLSKEDLTLIHAGLNTILAEIRAGSFAIEKDIEDVHSQVEYLLTNRIGEAGKKIHSGRSRNDQVAVDIKLYLRAQMLLLKEEVRELLDLLIRLSEQYKDKLLPGYTHLQMAMPSSFGLWFGAYAESLIDDLEVLAAAWQVTNKNPLGSGAGYGSSFPLNRELTTQLLHFRTFNYNSVYLQMTRLMLSNIQVKDDILKDEKYKYLFSVEAVNELVNKGVSFRDAYKQVGNQIDKGEFHYDYKQLLHTHEGSIGNLSNDRIVGEMEKVLQKFA